MYDCVGPQLLSRTQSFQITLPSQTEQTETCFPGRGWHSYTTAYLKIFFFPFV